MEIRRTLILIALAMTSYFLFLSWQRDYAPKEATVQAPAANLAISENGAGGLPQATTASSATAEGLPVAPVPAPATAALPAAVGSKGLVDIRTDVLDLQIDPVGGDIVRVSLPAYTRTVTDKTPFVLLDRSPEHLYIAQSGLIRAGSAAGGLDDNPAGRPRYQADQSSYVMAADQKQLDVTLKTTTAEGLEVLKTFHFNRGDYRVKVSYDIRNHTAKPWSGVLFGQLKRDNAKDPSSENHSFGMVTFLGGAWWTEEKSYNKLALAKFGEKPVNEKVTGGWVAMVQHYFVSAWIPDSKSQNSISTRDDNNGAEHNIGFTSTPVTVATGSNAQVSADFYAGP